MSPTGKKKKKQAGAKPAAVKADKAAETTAAPEKGTPAAAAAAPRRPLKKRWIAAIILVLLLSVVPVTIFIGGCGLDAKRGGAPQLDSVEGMTENIYTLLFIGIDRSDARTAEGYPDGIGLADTLILAAIDRETGAISMLSIPRDTVTEISYCTTEGDPYYSAPGQITYQYAYGGSSDEVCAENTVKAAESVLYSLPIDDYVVLDMDAIPMLVDSIGGIPIEIPDDESYCAFTGYTPGQWVLLDGDAAMQFVQYRDTSVFGSSEGRVERQKLFLRYAMDAVRHMLSNPVLHNGALRQAIGAGISIWKDHFCTSLSVPQLAALVWSMHSITVDSIAMHTVPGEVSMGSQYEEFTPDADALQALLAEMFCTS